MPPRIQSNPFQQSQPQTNAVDRPTGSASGTRAPNAKAPGPHLVDALFLQHANKNWMEEMSDIAAQQPNLSTVLTTLDWLLPKDPSETFRLCDLEVTSPDAELGAQPDTFRIRSISIPHAATSTTERQNPLSSMLSKLRIKRSAQPQIRNQDTVDALHSATADATVQLLPHSTLLKKILNHLIEAASQAPAFRQGASTHLLQRADDSWDISPALRDHLLQQIKETESVHQAVDRALSKYPSLSCLAESPSTDNLIDSLYSLANTETEDALPTHRIPHDVRQAILLLHPNAAPVLSFITRSLHLAGHSSRPSTERFLTFDQSDPTYLQRQTQENPCYYKTFLAGIERLADDQNGHASWQIHTPKHVLPVDHFGKLLALALKQLTEEPESTAQDLGCVHHHWPLSLHVLTHRHLGTPLSPKAIEADKNKHLDIEEAKQVAQASEISRREAWAREEERKREFEQKQAADWKKDGVVGLFSNMVKNHAPDLDCVSKTTEYAYTLPLEYDQEKSSRSHLQGMLGQRFFAVDMSARRMENGQLGGRDNQCWLRATWTSVIHQLSNCEPWKLEAPAFHNRPESQAKISALLKGLKTVYGLNPGYCLGQNDPNKAIPVHICPDVTVKEIKQLGGNTTEVPGEDDEMVESALKRLTANAAIAFRFENSDYAKEVEHALTPLAGGAAAELPIGLHRALLLPTVVIELSAINAPTVQIRVALPKDDSRYPAWMAFNQLPEPHDAQEATQRIQYLLSLFSDLPIIYLEKIGATDTTGHYNVYLPRQTQRTQAAAPQAAAPQAAAPQAAADKVAMPTPTRATHPHITGLIRNINGHVTQVVAASARDMVKQPNLKEHVRARLLDLIQDPHACLIGFGSPASANRLRQRDQPGALRTNASSLLEQTLAALQNAGQSLELAPNLWLQAVQFDADTSTRKSGDAMTGHLLLLEKKGEHVYRRKIPFMQFHPPYDGVAMKSADLYHALADLKQWLPAASAAIHQPLCRPHFFSAGGVGRSASLAVLMSATGLAGNGARTTIDIHDIDTTIANVRSTGGTPNFVNTPQQLNEIRQALLNWTHATRQQPIRVRYPSEQTSAIKL